MKKWTQAIAAMLALGASLLVGSMLGTLTGAQPSASPATVHAATSNGLSLAQAHALRNEIEQLRHQVAATTGAQFRGFVDNGCVSMSQTAQDAALHPSTGPKDPRLISCPYNRDHLGPLWSAQPSPTQMAIYARQLLLFPLNVTLAEANAGMQAALAPLSQ